VANDRHHQALGRLGRDADVVLAALHDFASGLVEGGVELRVLRSASTAALTKKVR
jgi:hypothetical protein